MGGGTAEAERGAHPKAHGPRVHLHRERSHDGTRRALPRADARLGPCHLGAQRGDARASVWGYCGGHGVVDGPWTGSRRAIQAEVSIHGRVDAPARRLADRGAARLHRPMMNWRSVILALLTADAL